MDPVRFGVVGGSGIYQIEGLTAVEERQVDTPFGAPSDLFMIGTLNGQRIAFLPRHGRGHRILPSELPNLANIYAFKQLGVERIISVTAVGSMREDYAPLDIVIPDQVYDQTKERARTFFGKGVVAHISFAEPFCPELNGALYRAAVAAGARTHNGGTLVVIEGPQFSTQAESRINRQLGADLVGMTALPEARLAREAEICYSAVAMVTDYDVWHESHESVSADLVVRNLLQNAEMGKKILSKVIPEIPLERAHCPCHNALKDAIITNANLIPTDTRAKLELLVGKYLSPVVE